MDPVTAFSLVAGVLQVVDLSIKALSKCREITKDGSLAQHRDTEEIANLLSATTNRLQSSTVNASDRVSEESKDIIAVCEKCTVTAGKLVSELKTFQYVQGDGPRQIMKKSVRAMRKKKFLAEMQRKLEQYQHILDTRILVNLDTRAAQQDERFEDLDQKIKFLIAGINQGQNKVAQLIANQTLAIHNHIDRRFDEQTNKEDRHRMKKDFRDSLFFPEIFARQDNIRQSHEGTCRWIFGAPQIDNSKSHRSSASEMSSDLESQALYYEKSRLSSSFPQWLKNGDDIYWLSGKPGSGKSTLMKYITSEFTLFCEQKGSSVLQDTSADHLMMCTYFFWNLGSPMQKNYTGFLRSLLYQIAEQQDDLLSVIMHRPAPLPAWTKNRLEDALLRFLDNKASSAILYFFIDGLDEFEGDEECLLDLLRLISRTSNTHVCVSSRPEQIFRKGFVNSPKLQLQDLNYPDIKKATTERLLPTLKDRFPSFQQDISRLIDAVIDKSQGIFLWAELMSRDLKKGVSNADTMQELHQRLDQTPDTIQGLYNHMLQRLDKLYLRAASGYFHSLMLDQEYPDSYAGLTLLHFACAEQPVWDRILDVDDAYFQSPTFLHLCRDLETRILTRSVGLVEIADEPRKSLQGLWVRAIGDDYPRHSVMSGEPSVSKNHVSGHLREVRFIHKTVVEFLQAQMQLFPDPNWRIVAAFASIRGKVGVLSLSQCMGLRSRYIKSGEDFFFDLHFVRRMVHELPLAQSLCPSGVVSQSLGSTAIPLEAVYKLLTRSITRLNGPGYPIFGGPIAHDDIYGFAAVLGCHDYILHRLATAKYPQPQLKHIISCVILGLDYTKYESDYHYEDATLLAQIGHFKILLKLFPELDDPWSMVQSRNSTGKSRPIWEVFLRYSIEYHRLVLEFLPQQPTVSKIRQLLLSHYVSLWKAVFTMMVELGADINYCLCLNLVPSTGIVLEDEDGLVVMKATILAIIELSSNINPIAGDEIKAMLKSRGAINQKRILSIQLNKRSDLLRTSFKENPKLEETSGAADTGLPSYPVCLSLNQSERLLGVITPKWDLLRWCAVIEVSSDHESSFSDYSSSEIESEKAVNEAIRQFQELKPGSMYP